MLITAIAVIDTFYSSGDVRGHGKRWSRFWVPTQSSDNRKRKKEKIFWTREWRNEEERKKEFQLHTQEGQDFSVAAAAAHLITHMSSESPTMDLTNNGMVNHYLRDVDHGSHCIPRHRTTCFTYMSE